MPPVIELAKPVAKKLKICLYGASGSGKTLAALTFPRVLLVDAENGSDLYVGRPGMPQFHVTRCKTVADLEYIIAHVEKDAGATYDTLVIDPITVFYDVEKNVQSANNSKDLGFREWARINNRMNSLYNRLTSLPVHVVVIARETPEYTGEGNNLRKIGVKVDADKDFVYSMDFVLHLKADHSAQVEKSRGVELGSAGRVNKVEWSIFAPVASLYTTGATLPTEGKEDAARRALEDLTVRENAVEFVNAWRSKGLTDGDLLKALAVEKISLWSKGRAAADEAVNAYIDSQMKPATPKADADTLTSLSIDVEDLSPGDALRLNREGHVFTIRAISEPGVDKEVGTFRIAQGVWDDGLEEERRLSNSGLLHTLVGGPKLEAARANPALNKFAGVGHRWLGQQPAAQPA